MWDGVSLCVCCDRLTLGEAEEACALIGWSKEGAGCKHAVPDCVGMGVPRM